MTAPRVYATNSLMGRCRERLADLVELDEWGGSGAPPPDALLEGSRRADALLCTLVDEIDGDLLAHCPGLRVISSCSVGVDHISLVEATARGIPVGHTPGVLAETTADLAFGLMLAVARRIPEADAFVRSGGWSPERRWEPDMLLGSDLHGATLGIIGLGGIGQAVARRARGFDMRVLGWTRSGRSVAGVEPADLDDLLAAADFLSLHVALTPETTGLIGAAQLARMRPGAFLVSTARGGIVDEAALVDALRQGRLAGAALDVFAHEPLRPDDPLLAAPNVVLTPHIGSASATTRRRMADLAIDNLLAGLEGRPLPHCANPEVGGPISGVATER